MTSSRAARAHALIEAIRAEGDASVDAAVEVARSEILNAKAVIRAEERMVEAALARIDQLLGREAS